MAELHHRGHKQQELILFLMAADNPQLPLGGAQFLLSNQSSLNTDSQLIVKPSIIQKPGKQEGSSSSCLPAQVLAVGSGIGGGLMKM